MSARKSLWWLTVGALTALAVWPIWSARFPPMQDYPGQLFYTEVLRLHGDPASDYDRYYEFRFHPTYSTFYVTTLAFAKLVHIELAGKLSLSLYPLLIAVLVLRLGRRSGNGSGAWGALLLFPFAFNQQYFYGNINYFLSLPILLLAFLDFEDLLEGPLRTWPVVRQLSWQVVLIVTHPLSYLVFVALAIFGAILTRRQVQDVGRKLAIAAGMAVLLLALVWFEGKGLAPSGGKGLSPSQASGAPAVDWFPFSATLGFFALMFDGMQPWKAPDLRPLILWGGVLAVVLGTLVHARRKGALPVFPRRHVIALVLSILGMLVLPFQIGEFTYVNVRLAALVYFLLALVVAPMRFSAWPACSLVVLAGLCLVDSAAKQARLSAEFEEILPVLEKIPPRSRILPLVFDPGSPELDLFWFGPHGQEFHYYHVVVGGGFNPYLFGSPVDPVRVKPAEERPAPPLGRAYDFRWELHSADYQYFLVRGAPASLPRYMERHCALVRASGKWMLFERRS